MEHPVGRWQGILDSSLRSEYLMRVTTLTTCNENMREAKTGDHKGRPYDGIVGAYFRSNDRLLYQFRKDIHVGNWSYRMPRDLSLQP